MNPLLPGVSPAPIALEGRLALVRPLVVNEDAPALYEAIRGPELERLYRYLPVPTPATAELFQQHMAEWQARPATLQFVFIDRATGKPFGTSSYIRIEPNHRVLEVGYVLLAPSAQRTTMATEAQYLLARHVFEDLRYRRYEWKCDDRNGASRAAALRFGFRYEGTFRNHMIAKGENRDTAWFSIIDAEWPVVRSAFERWLSPENFDAQGRQRHGLAELRNGS